MLVIRIAYLGTGSMMVTDAFRKVAMSRVVSLLPRNKAAVFDTFRLLAAYARVGDTQEMQRCRVHLTTHRIGDANTQEYMDVCEERMQGMVLWRPLRMQHCEGAADAAKTGTLL